MITLSFLFLSFYAQTVLWFIRTIRKCGKAIWMILLLLLLMAFIMITLPIAIVALIITIISRCMFGTKLDNYKPAKKWDEVCDEVTKDM